MRRLFVLLLFAVAGCAQTPEGPFRVALTRATAQRDTRVATAPRTSAAAAPAAAHTKYPPGDSTHCTSDRATAIRELQADLWPSLVRADFPAVWGTLRQIRSLNPAAFNA